MVGDHTGILGAVVFFFSFFFRACFFRDIVDTLHHASWDSGHNKTKQTKFPLLRREEEKKEKEKQE